MVHSSSLKGAGSTFARITPDHLKRFAAICGEANVLVDSGSLGQYGHDETEDLSFPPEAVVKPGSAGEVSEILKICYKEMIPVTPRGAGTGLSGGALPVFGGVVLSCERLNRILNIDERNLQVTVEPGVITQVLQEAVIARGMFYPPDPASRGSCFIGGNIAENSGGPKAVKYGVVRDYVLNLEMVLPDGEIIRTGANVLKNSTGYNLTQLVVGSEGTLGFVTKIVLRLIPHPRHDVTMLVPFLSPEQACLAVAAIFQAGVTPSGLEFMERDALDCVFRLMPETTLPLGPEVGAHLLVEVDGNDGDQVQRDAERIAAVLERFECGEILFADTAAQKDSLWKMRRKVGEAVKNSSIYKEEDTVVPRAELPVLLRGVKEIGGRHGFRTVCYGHAGDGNLHVNILKGDMGDDDWNNKVNDGIREIFALVKSLNGTISGEHGIGYVQKEFMSLMFSEAELRMMRAIKDSFDPRGIMNPGKIFV